MHLSFKKSILSSLMLLAISSAAIAAPNTERVIVAPSCLTSKVSSPYTTLANSSNLSLIKISKQGLAQLIEAKAARSKTPCGGFIDVTNEWQQHNLNAAINAKAFLSAYETRKPMRSDDSANQYNIQYETQVNALLKQINPQDIWGDLTHLTQFQDRYADSDTGLKTARWIKAQVLAMAKNNNRTDVSVRMVATGTEYKQPSVVVKIGNSNEPGVVIGGHMDTLSSDWQLMPGADDDGSGTSSVLEVARILLSSNMNFKRPIYIIWYSAEEMGLVGSKYVVRDFKAKNIPVKAVLQMDMTGYEHKKDPTMWLITDNTNTELTTYLETLVKTYVKQPVSKTRCGYACSDHASWDHAGFTAAFPFEASFGNDDPYIHTSNDKMDALSLDHMTDFAKLGIAFAVELAEPEAT